MQDLDNGHLLDAIAPLCEAFVTVEKSIPWQQRLDHRPFAVILLRSRSNRLEHLLPHVPALLLALASVKPGEFREVG